MVFFVKPTPPTEVTRVYDRIIMYIAAAIVVILAVAQLFTFEDFGEIFASTYGMSGNLALVFAALVVSFEVAAIPFLLGMTLSPLARASSMVAGWVVSTGWVVLAIWALVRSQNMNIGLLGATVEAPASAAGIIFTLLLLGFVGYSAWVAWPFKGKRR